MRLTSKQREELWDACCGERDYPCCNICGLPVTPGQRWNASHDPLLPHALFGGLTGVAHERCNKRWNNVHDTPLVAKAKRIRQKHIGAFRPRSSIPGGRHDRRKRTVDGRVLDRATGEPWRR